MDYSYLHPRYVDQLCDAVILHSVAECRQALKLLERHRSAAGQELRHHLAQAVATLEAELGRRGFFLS